MFFDPYLFSVSAFLFKLLLCNNKPSKDMTNDGKSANGCRFRGCKKRLEEATAVAIASLLGPKNPHEVKQKG